MTTTTATPAARLEHIITTYLDPRQPMNAVKLAAAYRADLIGTGDREFNSMHAEYTASAGGRLHEMIELYSAEQAELHEVQAAAETYQDRLRIADEAAERLVLKSIRLFTRAHVVLERGWDDMAEMLLEKMSDYHLRIWENASK